MQLFIILALVAGAFAECPSNSHYTTCGTACPLTCDNYQNPPKFCVLMCKIGCECDEGYVKAKDGSCILPEECPAQSTEKSCLGEPETGMCRGYFPMFHYNVQTGTCQEFIYGGCGGNGNRYATEAECLQHCGAVRQKQSSSDVCDLPSETGVCRGFFQKYFFNRATGQCEKFVYGGCGGNGNNFDSVEECESTCQVQKAADSYDCDKAPETGLCNALFHRYYFDKKTMLCKRFVYGGCGGNKNNFASESECYDKCGVMAPVADVCEQEKVVGPCRAAFRRFYFNKATGQCEKFIYGGCSGNGNNFGTQEQCEATCLAAATNVCQEEKVVGPCKAAFRRFYFNKVTGQCEKFIYGGCDGNGNNFGTQLECESACLA